METMYKTQHSKLLQTTKKSVAEQVSVKEKLQHHMKAMENEMKSLKIRNATLEAETKDARALLLSTQTELKVTKEKAEDEITQLTKEKVDQSVQIEELSGQYNALLEEINLYRSMILGEEERMNKKRRLEVPQESTASTFDLKTFDLVKGHVTLCNQTLYPQSLKGWYLANQDRSSTFFLPSIKLEPHAIMRVLIGKNQYPERKSDACWLDEPWDGSGCQAVQLLDPNNTVRATIKVHPEMLPKDDNSDNCAVM